MKNKTFYVTTPIYYVNAEPHIGHAYTTILCDFMKRFYTMLNYDARFLTGTDEHGDKINEAAVKAGLTPQQHADKYSGVFRQTWQDIEIGFDDFIRTTEPRHIKVVQEILQKIYDNGDIYLGSYGGYYCVGCERFLTEKELVDGKCPEHNRTADFVEEKNYFFRMSKYQGWLIDYINANPTFIRPERYRNEVTAMLKGEVLEDLCISRPASRLSWGIPMPFDKDYVVYVWFDALINYVSALGYPKDEKFAKFWPAANHIIAKDIVKPHGIFWPTMLKAAGIEPYQHLNVHGYWNMDNAKMSKSLGNVVTPQALVSKYGNDQIRYFLLREMVFGNDAKFNEDVIADRINFDLANDLGNLVKRTFAMTQKYFDGLVPETNTEDAGRAELKSGLQAAADGYIKNCMEFQTSVGLGKLWEFIRSLNKYIDERKPWTLAKENKTEELAAVMRNLLEGICAVFRLLAPVLFHTAQVVLDAIGVNAAWDNEDALTSFDCLTSGRKIKDIDVLFPKVEKTENPQQEDNKEQAAAKQSKQTSAPIDISMFQQIDILVAKIITAEAVSGSDKLLQITVDLGDETRAIVSGIAKTYTPVELIGKKILLVANLKPAEIFGIQSNGMLLAAKKNKKDEPIVVFADDNIPLGAKLS